MISQKVIIAPMDGLFARSSIVLPVAIFGVIFTRINPDWNRDGRFD